ncbi:NADH dehydrogenase [ubiquinone] 1 beta subcomplex subunit 6-like [Anneissia japonica]|uniref:NADH dehydrogenase [ubiquinone] 1 beta subcomplex subunit 6-like n=1 Tax=Anneissia japonica TaxID=1529436 RepID=UPI00142590BC|nr:NADH dehydrogenase [ubiquinone] 1 beta subcomplex subunit 6-like [Anneissia japonica]
MTSPEYSKARLDYRPPAGANPEIPSWAKSDYVLNKWVQEERSRRRRYLKDQKLEAWEPLPRQQFEKPNKFFEAINSPFRKLFAPLNARFNYKPLHYFLYTRRFMARIVVPFWLTYYFIKYHVGEKGNIVVSKPVIYPE